MNYDDDNHERQFYSDNEHERLIEKFDSPVRGTYRDLDAFQVIEDGRVMVTLGVPNHRMPEEFVSAAERDMARAERDRYREEALNLRHEVKARRLGYVISERHIAIEVQRDRLSEDLIHTTDERDRYREALERALGLIETAGGPARFRAARDLIRKALDGKESEEG